MCGTNAHLFSEEFYDLVNDSLETSNLINAPNYAALISLYKLKLDSLEEATGYTNIRDTIITCSLVNPDSSDIDFKLVSLLNVTDNIKVYPNPVADHLTLRTTSLGSERSSVNSHKYVFTNTDGKGIHHFSRLIRI
jgi:hypothetical protein